MATITDVSAPSIRIKDIDDWKFPVSVTNQARLVIPKTQLDYRRNVGYFLDNMQVKDIVLVNQTSSKTSFSKDDVQKMVDVVISYLFFKALHFDEAEGFIELGSQSGVALQQWRYFVGNIKRISNEAGFNWKINKTA